ncbi:nucleotidyltransferase [Devosia sp. Leaf420]|nr:nucleotidyltransferase [Devosia sp. Leaf420]
MAALDHVAISVGLRKGMPVSKAQAMIKSLHVSDLDAAGDREAIERLALWALQRFSPLVAADQPDGIVMDIAGADHLHGGEEMVLKKILSQFKAAELSRKAALADTWGQAHALARYHKHPAVLIEPGQGASIIRDLPLPALRLPEATVAALRTLGFETIRDLASAPRATLTLRFGPEIGRRIDQAMGLVGEPIEPVELPEIIEVARPFGEPIGAADTIAKYIRQLVERLVSDLEKKGLGARRLDLLAHRVDNTTVTVRVGTALPIRDTKRLTRLLTDKIEKIDPGFGIEQLRLRAVQAESLDPAQMINSLVDDADQDVAALIDVLSNRMGQGALYRFAPVASDIPERSFQKIPPLSEETIGDWPSKWPRPTRLLPYPEPIETMALLPDHPPVWFTWRGVRRRIKAADGPERIFGEWWKTDFEIAAVRDYFRVEDETGERYWIYRSGDGVDPETGSLKWYLHGVFG